MSPRIFTERERIRIEVMARHAGDATVLRHAQALLWRDEGESIAEVSERLGVSRRTICYWQAHFRERTTLDLPARLQDGHRSGRPRTVSGIIDPLLAVVLDQDPRELGYRSTVWTAPCCSSTWRTCTVLAFPGPVSAWRWGVCAYGGNGPVISLPSAPQPGGKQKGAQTRAWGAGADGGADAG